MRAPEIPGYMWISSSYCWLSNWIVTGIFPQGVMGMPFTVLGLIVEGSKLSLCWPMCFKNSTPAAEMSAPESGNTSTFWVPVEVDILTVIIGAGSVFLSLTLYNWTWPCVLPSRGRTRIVLVDTWCDEAPVVVLCEPCFPLQTFAKCPSLWQCEHAWLYAGHCLRPPLCALAPHPGHRLGAFGCDVWGWLPQTCYSVSIWDDKVGSVLLCSFDIRQWWWLVSDRPPVTNLTI